MKQTHFTTILSGISLLVKLVKKSKGARFLTHTDYIITKDTTVCLLLSVLERFRSGSL